jgi:heme exporter protein C
MSFSSLLYRYAAPARFHALAGPLARGLWALAVLFGVAGLVTGFFIAPTDAQQGESYRILYLHVPVAWLSMLLYVVMAGWSAVGLAFNARLAFTLAQAIAPTGAMMTFLALWTGALWGQPTWGTWWVWDARLTSELILLLLYLGIIALHGAIDDPRRAARTTAVCALIGVVNVPIIYFSVMWWNTLHQGATINIGRASTIAPTMAWGLVLCTLGLWCHVGAVILMRARRLVLRQEGLRGARWVAQWRTA